MKYMFNNCYFIVKDIVFIISFKTLALNLNFIKKQINNLYVFECEKLVF